MNWGCVASTCLIAGRVKLALGLRDVGRQNVKYNRNVLHFTCLFVRNCQTHIVEHVSMRQFPSMDIQVMEE